MIGPAIETLELLQGARTQMAADLTTVYDLTYMKITSRLLCLCYFAENELKTIVEAWSDMKDHGMPIVIPHFASGWC